MWRMHVHDAQHRINGPRRVFDMMEKTGMRFIRNGKRPRPCIVIIPIDSVSQRIQGRMERYEKWSDIIAAETDFFAVQTPFCPLLQRWRLWSSAVIDRNVPQQTSTQATHERLPRRRICTTCGCARW